MTSLELVWETLDNTWLVGVHLSICSTTSRTMIISNLNVVLWVTLASQVASVESAVIRLLPAPGPPPLPSLFPPRVSVSTRTAMAIHFSRSGRFIGGETRYNSRITTTSTRTKYTVTESSTLAKLSPAARLITILCGLGWFNTLNVHWWAIDHGWTNQSLHCARRRRGV